MTKISLLYFPDCPNAALARAAIREAIEAEHLAAELEEIDISREDLPPALRGWGSPTILVDGADIDGGSPAPGAVSCRLYKEGLPSVAQIRARIRSATKPARSSSLPILSIGGALVAALGASACCVVPAVLAAAGISGAGFASSFVLLRPYFLAATAAALGLGFWLAYRRQPNVDACGCASPRSRRGGRVALWLSSVVIAGLAAYPFMFATTPAQSQTIGVAEIKLRVTGMSCESCTNILARRLKRVAGVSSVEVDFAQSLATVTHDGTRDPSSELVSAVEDVGYEAVVVLDPWATIDQGYKGCEGG
jgi:mercuric ion transport protein